MNTLCTSGYGIWGSLLKILIFFSEDTQHKPAKQLPILKREGIYLPFIHIQTLPILSEPFLSGSSSFLKLVGGKPSYCSPCERELSSSTHEFMTSDWRKRAPALPCFLPAPLHWLSERATQRSEALLAVRLGPNFTVTLFRLKLFALQLLFRRSK